MFDFDQAFEALTGYEPFPWQARLFETRGLRKMDGKIVRKTLRNGSGSPGSGLRGLRVRVCSESGAQSVPSGEVWSEKRSLAELTRTSPTTDGQSTPGRLCRGVRGW